MSITIQLHLGHLLTVPRIILSTWAVRVLFWDVLATASQCERCLVLLFFSPRWLLSGVNIINCFQGFRVTNCRYKFHNVLHITADVLSYASGWRFVDSNAMVRVFWKVKYSKELLWQKLIVVFHRKDLCLLMQIVSMPVIFIRYRLKPVNTSTARFLRALVDIHNSIWKPFYIHICTYI